MDRPLVSICCIVYNHEQYLRDCIHGFLMQKTKFAFEIIIHDDASTDNSPVIIREYQEQYPELFVPILQEENQYSKGYGILSTFVFPKARGKYIAICEGDDYWTDPLKLQKQVVFLESHEDYSMCFHAAEILEDSVSAGAVEDGLSIVEDRDYNSKGLFDQWIVPTASILFRKEMVLSYTTRHQEWVTRGDIDLVLKCSHCGRVRGMSEAMSVYRLHQGSVLHDSSFRLRERQLLPNHFRYILINYPDVDRKTVRGCISHAYYSRMKIQSSVIKKVCDLIRSLYWFPNIVISKSRLHLSRLFK